MGISTNRSDATVKTAQTTQNTSQATSLQGYENQTSFITLSDVGGGLASDTNLSIQTTDFGAVVGGLDLAGMSLNKASDLALAALNAQEKTLTQYFSQADTAQKEAFEIASSQAGSSWRDKALLAGALALVGFIVIKGRK